jgi:hypothetical protein
VVLVFQLAMASVMLAILSGFSGAIPLIEIDVLFGACLSLSHGSLFGCSFNSIQREHSEAIW